MASNKKIRGPIMVWLDRMPSAELVNLCTNEFFGSERKMKSAFKHGHYRAAPCVALKMVKWWASFGVQITLHNIRPDVYGPEDKGPVV